jgi:hypothetical protein
MGTTEKYRIVVRRVLMDFLDCVGPSKGECEYQPVFDSEHDRYLVIAIGWVGPERHHDIVIQLDIINGKIWLQCDNTNVVIAHDLERAGVPKHDIVLGFHHPDVRPLTEYAVA